jgi:hypothetical protein
MSRLSPYEEAARRRALQAAHDWTQRQARRLGVTEATVLLAVQKGLLAEGIEAMSPTAFVAEQSGRSLAPQHPVALEKLERFRRHFAPDHDVSL